MEQCLRIAVWMFLLTGYLQAYPATSPEEGSPCGLEKGDLGLEGDFLKDVSCNNVTFTSPKNVLRGCYRKAMESFEAELKRAEMNCSKAHRITMTREALEAFRNGTCLLQADTNCSFDTTDHKQFDTFLEATKRFVEQLNSKK